MCDIDVDSEIQFNLNRAEETFTRQQPRIENEEEASGFHVISSLANEEALESSRHSETNVKECADKLSRINAQDEEGSRLYARSRPLPRTICTSPLARRASPSFIFPRIRDRNLQGDFADPYEREVTPGDGAHYRAEPTVRWRSPDQPRQQKNWGVPTHHVEQYPEYVHPRREPSPIRRPSFRRISPAYQASSPSSRPSVNGGMRPEAYDGSVTWEEYASHFEDCAELSNWDYHTKVLYLAASLRGSARTFYMSLESEEKRNYFALTARMKQRFGSSKHTSKWLSALEDRRRQPGESITTLGDDLRQLAKKGYPNLDNKAQESIALNQMYKLISVEMKCRCVDRDCETVHEATEIIEKYEAIVGDSDRRRNVRVIDTTGVEPGLSDILQKLDGRLEKLESAVSAKHQGPRQRFNHKNYPPRQYNNGRRCYNCNSPEHLMRDCPTRPRPTNRDPVSHEADTTSHPEN